MQTGVYGSGYLGTVVSACLADFGTPVTCCHPDSSRMVEMAQGNVPFFEKNLTEVIKRNVRSGRLAYSTDMESFARKAQVIFLAEDTPQHLADLAVRIARLAPKPPILSIMTPVSVGTATSVEKRLKDAGLKATIVSQPERLPAGRSQNFFIGGKKRKMVSSRSPAGGPERAASTRFSRTVSPAKMPIDSGT